MIDNSDNTAGMFYAGGICDIDEDGYLYEYFMGSGYYQDLGLSQPWDVDSGGLGSGGGGVGSGGSGGGSGGGGVTGTGDGGAGTVPFIPGTTVPDLHDGLFAGP